MQDPENTTSTEKSNAFRLDLCEKLFSYTKTGQFADFVLVSSDNIEFFVHKCILIAASDFFQKIIDGELFDMPCVTAKVLRPIIKFLYTGKIDLTIDTVEEIILTAVQFQIKSLITECFDFMSSQLNEINCLGTIEFADLEGFEVLFNRTTTFASKILYKLVAQESFLSLKEHQLIAILSKDSRCEYNEDKLFISLLKWIDYDRKNRSENAHMLFGHIRYWQLKPEFIRQNRSKLPKTAECFEMICSWLEHHLLNVDKHSVQLNPVVKSSKMKTYLDLLFIGGGAIQSYDPELQIWSKEVVAEIPKRFDKVVAYKNKLVFSLLYRSLFCFDRDTKEVRILPEMNVKRRNFAMVVVDDKLFVIGGHETGLVSSWTEEAEQYCFTTGQWSQLAPMNFPLISPKVDHHLDSLYVAGDFASTLQRYDICANKWSSIEVNEAEPTAAFGFVQLGGKYYKVGGIKESCRIDGKDTLLRSLNVYNTQRETWFGQARMKVALKKPLCMGWSAQLIVCGGCNATGEFINLVQAYDPHLNKWNILSQLVEVKPSTDYGIFF